MCVRLYAPYHGHPSHQAERLACPLTTTSDSHVYQIPFSLLYLYYQIEWPLSITAV